MEEESWRKNHGGTLVVLLVRVSEYALTPGERRTTGKP